MYIDENAVYSVCCVSPSPLNVTKAQLYQVFPDPSNARGALVQKKFVPLPLDVPPNEGLVLMLRVVEYKDGRHPTPLCDKYLIVGKDGSLHPTTFCRIDLAYRSVYVKHVEFDFMRAHDAADAFLKWEEDMPRLLRFEHLYWASNGRFDTFKWKVLTRELMNGKTELERIVNAWNFFLQYSNKSPELEAWEQSHPMGNVLHQPSPPLVMMPQAPIQFPYQYQTVQRCPNGMKKGRSYYRRSYRNGGNQGPYMGNGWGYSSYMPQQAVMPPQMATLASQPIVHENEVI